MTLHHAGDVTIGMTVGSPRYRNIRLSRVAVGEQFIENESGTTGLAAGSLPEGFTKSTHGLCLQFNICKFHNTIPGRDLYAFLFGTT